MPNDGDGLCLFYSLSNFLTAKGYIENRFNDSASFQESGIVERIEKYIDKLSEDYLKLVSEMNMMDDIEEGAIIWQPKNPDMNHATNDWVIKFMTEITNALHTKIQKWPSQDHLLIQAGWGFALVMACFVQ